MGASKVIHALYTDDDVLMSAVKTVRQKNIISKKFIHHSQYMD
jgi:hypothetical protein